MSSYLGLPNNYQNLTEKNDEESDVYKIYDVDKKEGAKNISICLKVLDKENSEFDEDLDINFFINQLKKEEKILREIKSDYIIKSDKIIDNKEYLILEIDNYQKNLKNFMDESPIFEKGDKDIYKKIIISLVEALKELKEKGIIHRNIKPKNIYKLVSEGEEEDESDITEENFEIKLANFDCAVYKNEIQNSTPMGTFMYLAPEIINNKNYDEKSDLWSLGITLYELYFGCLPYGQDANIEDVENIIDEKEIFLYRKSYIPSLDVLFKRLLCINPDERMSLEELEEFVENDDFLKEDKIYNNEKYSQYDYTKIYEVIKMEEQVEYKFEEEEASQAFAGDIKSYADLFQKTGNKEMASPKDEKFKEEPKFNNIIYYDEIVDKNFKNKVYDDCEILEENTPGSFIFCEDFNSLKIVISEIYEKFKKDNKFKFNLITTGKAWENTIDKYFKKDENFDKIINKVCIYCKNVKKYNYLSTKDKIVGVWCSLNPIVNFIKKRSSKDILQFPLVKLVTYESYKKNYTNLHKEISKYYVENNEKDYKTNLKKMETLINEEHDTKKLKRSKQVLIKSIQKFDVKQNIHSIIKEYTNNSFHSDFSKWLMSLEVKYYYTMAYFTARLIYSLNDYGKKAKTYFNDNKSITYRGMKLPLINILPYKRAENKVILFSAFTSTSRSIKIAYEFVGQKGNNNNDFVVIFYIKNIHEENWISNGIDVVKLSCFPREQEILFQAFSFFLVEEVKINLNEKKAEIYLKTIGKKTILEEEIKKGKEIEFNKKEEIIEIKK